MEHKYTPKLHDEAWMCYVNWAGSRKQNSRRSWREVDVCEIGKTRTPLCLLQSRVSICCTISETKRKKICLTILFNISVLGDRGQEDRNSRRGRESELHRQTRKLETKSQEEPERHKKIQRDSPKKKKKKKNKKQKKKKKKNTIPKLKRNGSGIVVVTITKIPSYICDSKHQHILIF